MNMRRVRYSAILALTLLLFTPAFMQGENKTFGKTIIRHRATVGGECVDRNHCAGVVGDKAYNYQANERHAKTGTEVERGNLTVDRKGLQVDEKSREKFDLKKDDLEDVRSVHQYVETKQGIDGRADGRTVEMGAINVKDNRNVRKIENIVEVDGDIKNVNQTKVGTVELKNSKAETISNTVQVKGQIDAGKGQKSTVGGVILNKSEVTDGIDSATLIKGKK